MGNTFTEEAKLTQSNTSPTKTSGATEAKVISAPLVVPLVISCGFQEWTSISQSIITAWVDYWLSYTRLYEIRVYSGFIQEQMQLKQFMYKVGWVYKLRKNMSSEKGIMSYQYSRQFFWKYQKHIA